MRSERTAQVSNYPRKGEKKIGERLEPNTRKLPWASALAKCYVWRQEALQTIWLQVKCSPKHCSQLQGHGPGLSCSPSLQGAVAVMPPRDGALGRGAGASTTGNTEDSRLCPAFLSECLATFVWSSVPSGHSQKFNGPDPSRKDLWLSGAEHLNDQSLQAWSTRGPHISLACPHLAHLASLHSNTNTPGSD